MSCHDHGGGDVGMAEEILDGSDVGAGLEQAGCEDGLPAKRAMVGRQGLGLIFNSKSKIQF